MFDVADLDASLPVVGLPAPQGLEHVLNVVFLEELEFADEGLLRTVRVLQFLPVGGNLNVPDGEEERPAGPVQDAVGNVCIGGKLVDVDAVGHATHDGDPALAS